LVGSDLKLEYLLTAGLWRKNPDDDDEAIKIYLAIREKVEKASMVAELAYA